MSTSPCRGRPGKAAEEIPSDLDLEIHDPMRGSSQVKPNRSAGNLLRGGSAYVRAGRRGPGLALPANSMEGSCERNDRSIPRDGDGCGRKVKR